MRSHETITHRGPYDSTRGDARPFTIFVDGECPLCRREARALRRLDRQRGRLRVIDITEPDFDASAYGRSHEEMMAAIHGLSSDGRMVTGMEVFRRAYAAVGLGWLLAPTRWPGLRGLFDRLYRWFARNRMRLTGRGEDCGDQCNPAIGGSAQKSV